MAALACAQCGGLWLDNAASTTVVRGYDLDASELARRVDANALHAVATAPFQAATGGCPTCREPLRSARRGDVLVDYCEKHGTFFDRGELARMLLEHVQRAPAPPPAAFGPSMDRIRTEIRHEVQWENDPIGTALMDWIYGSQDWVNRWRLR